MNTLASHHQLKVCMVVHQDYFTDARVRRYVESLAVDGARVDVICVPAEDSVNKPAGKNITIINIPLGRKTQSRFGYMGEYLLAFFFYFMKLSWLHLKNRYDVIHVHNMPDFLVFAALIPKIMGTPILLDVHDIMPEFYVSKFDQGKDSLIVRILAFQEKISTSFASRVITVCQGAANLLQKRGLKPEKITLIYNTPGTTIFDRSKYREIQSAPREYFTLIFPGTHAPRYGLDIPIRALPALIPQIANIRLQIVGSQVEYTRELAALAREIGVAEFVEFIPTVPLDEIPTLLTKANVGIYPAIKEPYMDIAVPEKVFEYALMGLPIIATRLQITEELFSNKAVLFFESGQVNQFAECVLSLHRNPRLGDLMAAQAEREYMQRFSWENGKKEYYNLLHNLIREKTSP